MPIIHGKSNTIADYTGTVTVFNSLGATETAAATNLVRPSDWNSNHNILYTLTGNTNNASTVSGVDIVFSGGNGVTLVGSNSVIGFSVANQSVQTQNMVSIMGSTGNISFANGNGITFGANASTITASHNGLTTARASNDGVGLNTALTAGPLAWTVNSSGISLNAGGAAGTSTGFTGNQISGSMTHNTAGLALSLNHPAWLTTAMQSNAATISNINISAGTTSTNASAFTFNNANGISFGLGTGASAGSITASHNGLTTARASNDAIGLNTALTAGPLLWTVNSSGLSLNAGGAAGTSTGFTGANISGSMTHNTAGLALSLSVAPPGGGGGAAISAGVNSQSTGTVNFANSNGITFGLSNNGTMTASYNSTQFAGTGTSATNASITLNSNGLAISVAPPGAAAENNAINLLGANTAGNTTATGSTIGWSGLNVTLSGTNNSQVVISAPATSSLVGVGGISLSTNGSTISISNAIVPQSFFWGMPPIGSTSISQVGNGSIAVYPVLPEGAFTASRADVWASISVSSSSNSSHAGAISWYAALYTRNGATLSLASSGSQSYQWTNTSNNSVGSVASLRQMSIPININFTGGDLWIAVMSRSSTTNANWFTASNVLQSFGMHSGQVIGNIGDASNATRGPLGVGRYSATSTALPNSIAFSEITGGFGGTASASRLMPNIFFMNFTA